jgi:hypothetical protein
VGNLIYLVRTFFIESIFIMHRYFSFLLPLCLLLTTTVTARTLRVLFIGNSYVYTNDLPAVLKDLAQAGGDTIIHASSAPGGYTFRQHCTYAPTLNLLQQGNWDYIVLQEQSQSPAFPDNQVSSDVYPYAKKLDSLAHKYNACAKTVFYMTWGRKNGDAQNCAFWPPLCTYRGMDSLLQLRYGIMADQNNAWLAPVAKVWARLRASSPSIDLYVADESHPSPAGTFAAACSFYSLLLGKDPAANNYAYTLGTATANTIKGAAKTVVYDSVAYWQRHQPLPAAAFTLSANQQTVTVSNQSQSATGYRWNFGDGSTSTLANTTHTYTANGSYNVCLTAYNSCDSHTVCKRINIGNVSVGELSGTSPFHIFPNPAQKMIRVEGISSSVQYSLYTITGIQSLQGTLNSKQNSIDIRQLTNGIYFLQIKDATGIQEQRKIEVRH